MLLTSLAVAGGLAAGAALVARIPPRPSAHAELEVGTASMVTSPAFVGAVTGVTGGSVTLVEGDPLLVIVLLAWSVTAAWVLVEDVTRHRIPNRAVLLVSITGLLPPLRVALGGQPAALVAPAAAALSTGLLGALAVVITGQVGLGDVKLAAALMPLLTSAGMPAVTAAVVCIGLLSAATAVVAVARGKTRDARIPLGPALMYGAILGLFLASGPW